MVSLLGSSSSAAAKAQAIHGSPHDDDAESRNSSLELQQCADARVTFGLERISESIGVGVEVQCLSAPVRYRMCWSSSMPRRSASGSVLRSSSASVLPVI